MHFWACLSLNSKNRFGSARYVVHQVCDFAFRDSLFLVLQTVKILINALELDEPGQYHLAISVLSVQDWSSAIGGVWWWFWRCVVFLIHLLPKDHHLRFVIFANTNGFGCPYIRQRYTTTLVHIWNPALLSMLGISSCLGCHCLSIWKPQTGPSILAFWVFWK